VHKEVLQRAGNSEKNGRDEEMDKRSALGKMRNGIEH
jgi:hypothetical protein